MDESAPNGARVAGYGLGCLLTFVGAVLTVIGAVCLLGILSDDPIASHLFAWLAPVFMMSGVPTLAAGIYLARSAQPGRDRPPGAGAATYALGTLLRLLGFLSLLCLGLTLAVVVPGMDSSRADYSSFPFFVAVLGSFGVLGLLAGQKLTQGKPVWVASVRRLLGILLLLFAALSFVLYQTERTLKTALIAGVLLMAGLFVLLSWRKKIEDRPQ